MRLFLAFWTALALLALPVFVSGGKQEENKAAFRTSDRCVACHNGLITPKGDDVSG